MYTQKKRKAPTLKDILKYFSVFLSIVVITILLSTCINFILVQLLHFSSEKASMATNLVEGGIAALAAVFLLFELKQNSMVREQEGRIEEANFILEYNKSFITDLNMAQVESLLEGQVYYGIKGNIITDENRQQFINYLVYLESLAPLILNNVMILDHIDDLLAYRYFLAVNNVEIQEDQLLKFAEFYRGCFKVYKQWKEYRIQHGRDIISESANPERLRELDKCRIFDFMQQDITIRQANKKDDLTRIAHLIMETDRYIYPTAFGKGETADKSLAVLVKKEKGIFSYHHIVVAEIGEKICGQAVILCKEDKESLNYLPHGYVKKHIKLQDSASVGFNDAWKGYFQTLKEHFQDSPDDNPPTDYILCLSVDKKMRGMKIGEKLLNYVIWNSQKKNHGLSLDVITDNIPALELYKKCGFITDGNVIDGYAYKEEKPKCYEMHRPSNSSKLSS